MNIFIRSSRDPSKKANNPRLKTTVIRLSSEETDVFLSCYLLGGMGQFGDAVSAMDVSAINQLIRHGTFDGSAFVYFFEVLGLV